ncbi:MAG TPA: Yip1 family protein [Candidatus Krumholzibacteria bacterium]|nr:Yip1 family protein [Candidatus Krumholzibacteria bacterium]
MDFLIRLGWIFTSPGRVFDDIRERRVSWVQPWLISSAIYALITWIAMPIQRAILEVHPDLTTEQIDQQIEMMDSFGFMWVILAPAGALIITFVMAGLSYIAVTMASRAANFKQYLTLSFYTGIVGMMGQLVSALVIRARGLENITGPEDGQMALSLRAIAPDNAALRGLYGSIEFFAIWSLVLVAMGLMRIFGMSRGASIAVAVVLWVLYAGMMVIAEVLGGMAG